MLKQVTGTTTLTVRGPVAVKRHGIGIALVPEDRKTEALIQDQRIAADLELAALGVPHVESDDPALCQPFIDALDLKHSTLSQPASQLSGGSMLVLFAGLACGLARLLRPTPGGKTTMIWLASGKIAGLPVAIIAWMVLAAYLSGMSTPSVILAAVAIARICSAFGGVPLAGYANQAYQSMGDPSLLPTIATVVIGGTSIPGGRGRLPGTVGGAPFITLLTSILSVMQITNAWRSIIFGVIIIMLLFQTLRRKET